MGRDRGAHEPVSVTSLAQHMLPLFHPSTLKRTLAPSRDPWLQGSVPFFEGTDKGSSKHPMLLIAEAGAPSHLALREGPVGAEHKEHEVRPGDKLLGQPLLPLQDHVCARSVHHAHLKIA